jgi:hypothetical protein
MASAPPNVPNRAGPVTKVCVQGHFAAKDQYCSFLDLDLPQSIKVSRGAGRLARCKNR